MVSRDSLNRIIIGLLTVLIVCVICLTVSIYLKKDCGSSSKGTTNDQHAIATSKNHSIEKVSWLVSSPSCHIPDLDPFASDAMKIFFRQKYEKCVPEEDLTSIEMNWNPLEAKLVYNNTKFHNAKCCYSEISRAGQGRTADNEFRLSPCTHFNKTIIIPPPIEFIYVKCESGQQTVYQHTHAVIRDKPEVRKRLTELKKRTKNHRPLSVLMLSIDSVSRLNFMRAMPSTHKTLVDNNWFELQGYNKMDDNTWPNLMAILTGLNLTNSFNRCQPEKVGKLDTCPFLWNDFRDTGYAITYVEDEPSFSTFNSHVKVGFSKQPTDYYLRPYMLAAERLLPIKKKAMLNFCLGSKESGVHVYDYAMDFATHFKKDASFGIFWLNSFSHDLLEDPSSMDIKMKEYVHIMEERGILNESMVVMFSDHGLRYGEIRHLYTGWLEERLPFVFIWLPPWFQKEHPEIVEALKINRNRLTNPYDMHITLQHILKLADPSRKIVPAFDCPKCQSLFTEVPWNRSCEEISIDSHWCTCPISKPYDEKSKMIQDAAKFALDDINQLIEEGDKKKVCAKLKMKKVSSARKTEYRKPNDSFDEYLVTFNVAPSDGWIEQSVRHRENSGFEIVSLASRINENGNQSSICSDVYNIRLYCYCKILCDPDC